MKKLIKQLIEVDETIKSIDEEIEVTKGSEYYGVFGSEEEREKDISLLYDYKKNNIKFKHLILERIIIKAEKQKMLLSQEQRELNLRK